MVEKLRRHLTRKRIVLALIVANEIRGVIFVSPIVIAWWKLHHG